MQMSQVFSSLCFPIPRIRRGREANLTLRFPTAEYYNILGTQITRLQGSHFIKARIKGKDQWELKVHVAPLHHALSAVNKFWIGP